MAHMLWNQQQIAPGLSNSQSMQDTKIYSVELLWKQISSHHIHYRRLTPTAVVFHTKSDTDVENFPQTTTLDALLNSKCSSFLDTWTCSGNFQKNTWKFSPFAEQSVLDQTFPVLSSVLNSALNCCWIRFLMLIRCPSLGFFWPMELKKVVLKELKGRRKLFTGKFLLVY